MWQDGGFDPSGGRARLGWWVFILLLAVFAAFLLYSFVGMIVLGVFGYYATRPICRRLSRVINSSGLAAGATVLLVVVPILLLVIYTAFRIVGKVRRFIDTGGPAAFGKYLDLGALPAAQRKTVASLLQNPSQLLSQPDQLTQTLPTLLREGTQLFQAVFGGILLVALALALAYFLLEHDDQLAAGFRELIGGRDTVAYAYATAVDADLESVFFGNLLFVVAMSVIAGITYEATNLLAPPGLDVPMILVLSVLTGVTSLLPVIVSKIIYLPVVAYLGFQALGAGSGTLAFVFLVLIVYFLVLDILPQTFIQPYITGRQLDMMVLMFAYILGPILFGWYGFFLLPIVFIVMLEAVRIVLPELIRGEALTPTVSMAENIGTDPQSLRGEQAENEEPTETATESDDATADG
ncbi:MAG TPA: AI-2E family transporter [Halococcus sp.]|nr:AI-2E family transporter [Halococcus sp.]